MAGAHFKSRSASGALVSRRVHIFCHLSFQRLPPHWNEKENELENCGGFCLFGGGVSVLDDRVPEETVQKLNYHDRLGEPHSAWHLG